MAVRIPKQTVEGLVKLASLKDEQYLELRSALEAMPKVIRHQSIFDDREIQPKGILKSDFESIRNGIYPLLMGVATIPVPLSEYVKDVVQAVREEASPSEDSLKSLEPRLAELLEIPSTRLVAKAYDVLTEHGCTYGTARVLSDVRPIFNDDPKIPPQAAVIVHMLNIDHLEGNNRKTLAVALDTKDVDELIEILEKAKQRAEHLKSVLASTSITYIDVV